MKSPKSVTFNLGDIIIISEKTSDGFFVPLELYTVTRIKRNLIALTDKHDNEIVITREKPKAK